MSKINLKPSTMLYPIPAVMVSCADENGKANIITLAWAGTINSEPPMLSISIRRERYSYEIIKNTREFAVNLTTANLVHATDFCGVKSGRDIDKFKETGLTKGRASVIKAPLIDESPLSLECKVKDIIPLGSHDMFIAEIVAVSVDEVLMDEKGKVNLNKSGLICYSHGEYRTIGKALGFYGYSVVKRKHLKRHR